MRLYLKFLFCPVWQIHTSLWPLQTEDLHLGEVKAQIHTFVATLEFDQAVKYSEEE